MNYRKLRQRLTHLYDEGEAKSIVRWILEERFGLSTADIVGADSLPLTDKQATEMEQIMLRLEAAEPVQYILGQTCFCGRPFRVSPSVLIPRPETETLCRRVIETALAATSPLVVLDACTGSGCIAVTLALDLPCADVSGCDLSEAALQVAQENAEWLGAKVKWNKWDVLRLAEQPPTKDGELLRWDVMISNPPYICERERAGMSRNVLEYEPHTALFVPDEDPLRFYRSLACYASVSLKTNGRIFFEVNPLFVNEIRELLAGFGFERISSIEDEFGKQRFVEGTLVRKPSDGNRRNGSKETECAVCSDEKKIKEKQP